MKRYNRIVVTLVVGILLAVIVFIGMEVRFANVSSASGLTQGDIEAKAVTFAHRHGLQSEPTNILSKRITIKEFDARLDPFANEPSDSQDNQVWLVSLRGKVVWGNPPLVNGNASYTSANNMWILLDTNGNATAWGSEDSQVDPNSAIPTPVQSWPRQPSQDEGRKP